MTARKTLSLRGPAERQAAPPRAAWNVSETRREPTEAEKALWARLAGQTLGGYKFHRQVVIGSTIVDFACPSRWLVVEISGEANPEIEALQDRKLADVGIRVLRFSEEKVLEDVEPVAAAILAELQKPFDRRAERAANAKGRRRDEAAEAMFETEPEEAA
jgi:very-short-patch-repair endonuclease